MQVYVSNVTANIGGEVDPLMAGSVIRDSYPKSGTISCEFAVNMLLH